MIRTAECVSPLHPDKICDRISDIILDMYLEKDPRSRCAIETCGGHGLVFITGEVTSKADITHQQIQNKIFSEFGDSSIKSVVIHLKEQSPEIAKGVDQGGAGDQGIMIGYACNENEDMVPQEYYLARELNKYVFSRYPYDGKTQITINNNNKIRVVCSFQNVSSGELDKLTREFFKLYPEYIMESLHINPAGDWNIGGLEADAGLTGRKLAVDNYGPRVPLGGGAFSGKDSTKVDRSAAYMARRIAVDYLTKLKAREVVVTLAYAIGYDQPLQATVSVDGTTFQIIDYDLSPNGIIDFLDLRKPIYAETAKWGHMGNNFSWK